MRENTFFGENLKGFAHKRGSERGDLLAVGHLENLNAVLKVHQASGTEFGIEPCGACLLHELFLSEIFQFLKIQAAGE